MDAKGYGEEHPIADNSTDAGRQQNRRISLHVTEK
jgi:OOP family OmpA-OmpF porin